MEHVACEGQDWKLFLVVLGSKGAWVRVESLAAETLEAGSAAEEDGGEHSKPCRGKRRVTASNSGRRKRHSPLRAVFCPDVSGTSRSVVPTAALLGWMHPG